MVDDTLLKKRICDVLVMLGGPCLSLDCVYIIQNPKGGSFIGASVDGTIVHLAILKSYATADINVLAAKIAHEYANVLVPARSSFFGGIEQRLLLWGKRKKKGPGFSVAVRTVFEGLFGGAFRMLRTKRNVDAQALALLNEKGFPTHGYIAFLADYYSRCAEFNWPRRIWRRWIMKRRIRYAMQVIRSFE